MEIDVSLGTGGDEVTTDREKIRSWVEEQDGRPAVDPDATETMAALRFEFRNEGEGEGDAGEEGAERDDGNDSLEPIEWSRFFREFDEWDLALSYREGGEEPSYEFVDRKATLRA